MTHARKPTAADSYALVVEALGCERGVSLGAGKKKGFGAGALSVNGKIFAMLSSRESFVVKLPAKRVAALVAAGQGRPFETKPGRPMKEWFEATAVSNDRWIALAREALIFVAASA